MNAIEKLVDAAKEVLEWSWYTQGDEFERLQIAIEEYERTKPMDLPAEYIVPDWVEWCTLDADGAGCGYISPPKYGDGDYWVTRGKYVDLGQFKPPEDWKKARWHKEEGKWVAR